MELVPVSFKDMSLEQVGAFISEKLGKPVLVSDEVKGKKITIINKKSLPLEEALFLIRQVMLTQSCACSCRVSQRTSLLRPSRTSC